MGILGIENRTENWKTVQHFHGLSNDAKVRLVQKLGEPAETPADKISLELFWKGVRDYVHTAADKPGPEKVAEVYKCHFSDLRQKVMDFRAKKPPHNFQPLKDHNYSVADENQDALCRNLQNTEIDIVLETPSRLFIGEAKHESNFGGEGKLILVHQLIRQYVTAKVLIGLTCKTKTLVPFIVVDKENLTSAKDTAQVRFMIAQGWLERCNVLSWDNIKILAG